MPGWFKALRRRVDVAGHLSWRGRLLLIEATAALGLARLLVVAAPFRWLAPRLSARSSGAGGDDPNARDIARRVGQMIALAARATPWRSRCLEQAIAGQMLLRRRGLCGTLHLGVLREGATLEAHAWLLCGEQIVTGGNDVERFVVVARFGEQAG